LLNKISSFLLVTSLITCFSSPALAGGKIDWAKINPNLKGATSVGNTKECLNCHLDYVKSFLKTKHARAYKAKFGLEMARSCEVCHGPLSKHMELKMTAEDFAKKIKTVVSFKNISAKARSAICLQCHENSLRMQWRGSAHETSGVSCKDCHYVMKKKSKRRLFIAEDPKKACFQCHRDKRAKMLRTSHMPLREGKMDCASCHNPHGGPGPSLLKKATVNETCFQCHMEKRGPLLWEHPPVRENCANCHDPHGSNFKPLLKTKVPWLCQQCHSDTTHAEDRYDGNTINSMSQERIFGKACLNCHSKIHGSNHPSGQFWHR